MGSMPGIDSTDPSNKFVQDYSQAMKLYKLSAEEGYDLAMLNLGYLYYKLAQMGQTFQG